MLATRNRQRTAAPQPMSRSQLSRSQLSRRSTTMHIYSNSRLFTQLLPGIAHRTLAGPEHGLRALEVWSQRIDASAATPPHRHDCEEVVVVLEGEGTLTLQGTER